MSGLPDEGPTPRSSRQVSSTRCDTIYIPSDDFTPISFRRLFSPPKRQIKDTVPHISGDAEISSFKSQRARHQVQKPLAGSTRKAPLQQNFKLFQARATTVNVPGTGGGKENVPPGFPVITNKRSKSEDHSPVSKMAHPVVQDASLRACMATKSKEAQIEPLKRVALGETRGNVVRRMEPSPPAGNPLASALKQAFSAIVIQRAWRSFIERRNKNACDIATAKVELACEVITRWWHGVKACKLREQKQKAKLAENTEQTSRRKPASQRRSVRQGHQSSGRRGIRRL
ncbi:hypothetical protein N7497_005581 [Penicillium chrysogenum]|uniref:Uncharacterized protein n=1 Tax=Penicillium chrysogenum TaxID=5076 RepID=A0ABQ8WR70_PENCH|nr:hypothetical protein N7505_003515 [Penicillium chrysogenum]KAJ5285459.1 hypothetical protein N7524_000765 [Penicillium chrysogenum]KAJ6156696.1 hypothetical protein N7497_005581 [Penicillium chrysogenum]